MPKVIVPVGAGVGSAIGLLTADAKIDVALTRILRIEPDNVAVMRGIYADLETRAKADLANLNLAGAVKWRRGAYMRYAGQGFEIRVDLSEGDVGLDFPQRAVQAFEAAYQTTYGYADSGALVEAVDWYLIATVPGIGDKGAVSKQLQSAGRAEGNRRPDKTTRRTYFPEAGGYVDATVIDRDNLRAGTRISGPALIEEREAMTVILPGDVASISSNGHLVIEIAGGNP